MSWLETSLFFSTVVVLGTLAWAASRRDMSRGQRDRDYRASVTMNRLLGGGETPPFSIYLRTFGVTGELGVKFKENRLLSAADRDEHRDLETLLAQAFETYQPLLALGSPGEHFGAGRILTDDVGWQDKIDLLLKKCSTIIMIPSHRSGTKWEVGWLFANGLIARTLFLMPSKDRFTKYDMKKNWDEASERLSEIGLTLPPYAERGGLFVVDESGKVKAMNVLPRKVTPKKLRYIITTLSAELGTERHQGGMALG